jgi:hypothetical protein
MHSFFFKKKESNLSLDVVVVGFDNGLHVYHHPSPTRIPLVCFVPAIRLEPCRILTVPEDVIDAIAGGPLAYREATLTEVATSVKAPRKADIQLSGSLLDTSRTKVTGLSTTNSSRHVARYDRVCKNSNSKTRAQGTTPIASISPSRPASLQLQDALAIINTKVLVQKIAYTGCGDKGIRAALDDNFVRGGHGNIL